MQQPDKKLHVLFISTEVAPPGGARWWNVLRWSVCLWCLSEVLHVALSSFLPTVSPKGKCKPRPGLTRESYRRLIPYLCSCYWCWGRSEAGQAEPAICGWPPDCSKI